MLKKAVILAAVLTLLLASAQLALAQQDAQQGGGSPTPPPGGPPKEPPPAGNKHEAIVHLNENDELVIDCARVDTVLARFAAINDNPTQPQGTPQPTDAQAQSALTVLQELSQLCAESGFTPVGSGSTAPSTSSPTDTGSTQPQQSGGTPSPTDTSSAQPHQNMDSHIFS